VDEFMVESGSEWDGILGEPEVELGGVVGEHEGKLGRGVVCEFVSE
jgi:hypothetical protein